MKKTAKKTYKKDTGHRNTATPDEETLKKVSKLIGTKSFVITIYKENTRKGKKGWDTCTSVRSCTADMLELSIDRNLRTLKDNGVDISQTLLKILKTI